METLKSLNWKKYIKVTLSIVVSLTVLCYLAILGYSYLYEQDKIAIDRYNFEQLEKVKGILNNPDRDKIRFNTLEEFNKAYNASIQPTKNCYAISSHNGDAPYIFGFQIESLFYTFSYFRKYYIYPSYSVPYRRLCYGLHTPGEPMAKCDYTDGFESFISVVSSPCED